MSTRSALGASAQSILRQVLTESLLLSCLGGGVGLLLGYMVRNAIKKVLKRRPGQDPVHVNFDWTVVLFTIGNFFGGGTDVGLARRRGRLRGRRSMRGWGIQE